MTRSVKNPSDRAVNRLIAASILVLAVGIPLIGALYLLDQYRDPGPSLVDRDITVAEEAVRKDPNLLTARLALADAYAKRDRLADAVTQYDEILAAEPDAGSALLGRAAALFALGDYEKAKTDFQHVVDLAKGGEMARVDPQLEAAYFGLGNVALAQGRAEDAVINLSSAVEINRTDADALNLLGAALLKVGEPERAVTATRKAIALVPIGWCAPYTQLADAYAAMPDAAGVAYARGMVAVCEGRAEAARGALEPLVSGSYAVDALVGLGLLAETRDDRTAATDAYRRALEKDPTNFAAMTGLGRVSDPTPAASGSTGSPAPAPTGGD